jgi:aspartyl protease family protein
MKAVAAIAAVACVGGVLAAKSVDLRRSGPETPRQAMAAPMRPPVAEAASPRSGDAPRRTSGSGPVTIQGGQGGHFRAMVEIGGRRIPMIVDTGATVIALTAEDARAVGVQTFPADYEANVSTANGVVKAAPAMLREVRIEDIVVYNVKAFVMPRGALSQSLLGMSFLKKLRGFEIADNRLVMRP